MKSNLDIKNYIADSHKRIFFLLPNFGCGGAEKFLLELAEIESAKGKNVKVIVVNDTGSLTPSKKLKIINFNKAKVALSLFPLIKILRANPETTLMTTMYHCNIIATIARLFAKDIFLITRESTSYSFYKNNFSYLKLITFKLLSRVFYSLSDELIFPSVDMRESFLNNVTKNVKSNSIVKGNPLNIDKIVSLSLDCIPSSLWIKNPDVHTFISVGRLDENKNHIAILKAVNSLKKKGFNNFEFILIGDGPLKGSLENYIKTNKLTAYVKLLGFQSNPYKFLKRSQTFILSSFSEGYPNVLVQAQAFDLNIISTDCPTGPREILEDYEKSSLVSLDKLENIELKMEGLI